MSIKPISILSLWVFLFRKNAYLCITQKQRKKMTEKGVIFNHDHYMKVYRARKARGLKVHSDDNKPIVDHPLKGKTFISKKDGKLIHIQDVYKHWNKGYYYCILYYTWMVYPFLVVNHTESDI
jgi:hypothetical protein